MAYTLAEVTVFYDTAKAAYLKALTVDEYSIKDRSKRNQELKDLKAEMDMWSKLKDSLDAGDTTGKINVKVFVPRDR